MHVRAQRKLPREPGDGIPGRWTHDMVYRVG